MYFKLSGFSFCPKLDVLLDSELNFCFPLHSSLFSPSNKLLPLYVTPERSPTLSLQYGPETSPLKAASNL
jgi:hypothetical protein